MGKCCYSQDNVVQRIGRYPGANGVADPPCCRGRRDPGAVQDGSCTDSEAYIDCGYISGQHMVDIPVAIALKATLVKLDAHVQREQDILQFRKKSNLGRSAIAVKISRSLFLS